MVLDKKHWAVIFFTLAYIFIFGAFYIQARNYEFLWYVVIMLLIFGLVALTIKKSKLSISLLWMLSIWGLLHMAGGGVIIKGEILYALEIFHFFDVGDTFVLKYDQIVHFYGFFVTALVAFHLLSLRIENRQNMRWIYIAAALISMGLGVVNEIVEFIATVSFENVNVGGYYNTSIDLIANTLGAFCAIIWMRLQNKKR